MRSSSSAAGSELEIGDLGLQLFGKLAILLGHCRADFLGSGVAARLHILDGLNDGAALLVERYEALRQRLRTALRKRCIKSLGILTNPSDIKHLRSRSFDISTAPTETSVGGRNGNSRETRLSFRA